MRGSFIALAAAASSIAAAASSAWDRTVSVTDTKTRTFTFPSPKPSQPRVWSGHGGRKMAAGRYKGSRWAKRATRRGGNPAAVWR